jgi:hypothetical protein
MLVYVILVKQDIFPILFGFQEQYLDYQFC